MGAVRAARTLTEQRRAQRRGRLPLALAFGAVAGFALVMALVLLGDADAFDVRVTLGMQRAEHPLVLGLMVAVSWLGFQPQASAIVALVLAALWWRRLRLESGFAALALVANPLAALLKLIANRPRPSAALDGIVVYGNVGGRSFPSGHVLSYVAFCGFLAYLVHTLMQRAPWPRRALLAALLALIVLVGPSHVFLGQHWFTDVLASYLLGSALLVALLATYRRAKRRQLARAATMPGSGE